MPKDGILSTTWLLLRKIFIASVLWVFKLHRFPAHSGRPSKSAVFPSSLPFHYILDYILWHLSTCSFSSLVTAWWRLFTEEKLKEGAKRKHWTHLHWCAVQNLISKLTLLSLSSSECERLHPSSLMIGQRLGISELVMIFCLGFSPAWWVTLYKALHPPPLPFYKMELVMLNCVFH